MARSKNCTRCFKSFSDDVTFNEHSAGSAEQEVEVDDVPTLCLSCNRKAVSKF